MASRAGIPNRSVSSKAPNVRPLLDDWSWQQEGNCFTKDSSLFFLDENIRMSSKTRQENAAKSVCVGCPVLDNCLSHALSVPENYGVWGGTTPEEREVLKYKLNNKSNLTITDKEH
jgi:WhiB family redox-sensing transcriptional regulator